MSAEESSRQLVRQSPGDLMPPGSLAVIVHPGRVVIAILVLVGCTRCDGSLRWGRSIHRTNDHGLPRLGALDTHARGSWRSLGMRNDLEVGPAVRALGDTRRS